VFPDVSEQALFGVVLRKITSNKEHRIPNTEDVPQLQNCKTAKPQNSSTAFGVLFFPEIIDTL